MFLRAIAGAMMCLAPAAASAQRVELLLSDPEKVGAEEGADEDAAGKGMKGNAGRLVDGGTPAVPESYEGKLEYGHGLYMKGNFAAAKQIYDLARGMRSTDPLVLYYVACAEVRLGAYDAAVETLTAMKAISGEKIASLTAKALFLLAVIEEMREDDEKSIEAWKAYGAFVVAHPGVPGFGQTAESRIAALEEKRERYDRYAGVRERVSRKSAVDASAGAGDH